jgi:hypothetical protein
VAFSRPAHFVKIRGAQATSRAMGWVKDQYFDGDFSGKDVRPRQTAPTSTWKFNLASHVTFAREKGTSRTCEIEAK